MSSFTKDVKDARFYTSCTISIALLLSSYVDLTHLVSQWEYRWTSKSNTWQRCHYLSTHIIRCYYLISPIFFRRHFFCILLAIFLTEIFSFHSLFTTYYEPTVKNVIKLSFIFGTPTIFNWVKLELMEPFHWINSNFL